MSSKKDLIDFLVEYLVSSNAFYHSNVKSKSNKNIKNTIYLNSKLYDIKLDKFANNKYLEKKYKDYKL